MRCCLLAVLLLHASLAQWEEEDQSSLLQRGKPRKETEPVKTEGRRLARSLLEEQATLPDDAAVRDVRFRRSADGKKAQVTFTHNGRHFDRELVATSVYTDDAARWAHRAHGNVQLERGLPTTFSLREEGAWAQASVFDGDVFGLFELEKGHVVRVQPAEGNETLGHESPHLVHRVQPPIVAAPGPRKENASFAQQRGGNIPTPMPEGNMVPPPHKSHETEAMGVMMHSGTMPQAYPNSAHDNVWTGDSWIGGCYSGDTARHQITLSIFADIDFFQDWGTQTAARLEHAVSEASFVYERQMNIQLRIAVLMIYESSVGAPAFAVGCPPEENLMNTKLDQLTSEVSSFGFTSAAHLFTGCGRGFGVVGLAYVGTLCQVGWNTGVNQFTGSSGWLVFAHELGHNFAGDHSFEEGQGTTGGIMDYGDGRLRGEFQFNTRYRRTQMCAEIQSNLNNCFGTFTRIGAPGPPPPPSVCADVPGYRDRFWHTCEAWVGHDCFTWTRWYKPYNDADRFDVRNNCPQSCGLCR